MNDGEDALLVEDRAPGVRLLTFNRPDKRNALATPPLSAVAGALLDAQRTSSIRCVVITGGSKIFAAGADIR